MKHCKIHNQNYIDNLHDCPICAGEILGKENPPKRIRYKHKKQPKPKVIVKLRKKTTKPQRYAATNWKSLETKLVKRK